MNEWGIHVVSLSLIESTTPSNNMKTRKGMNILATSPSPVRPLVSHGVWTCCSAQMVLLVFESES
jgi:hypothetical protein